MTGKETEAEKVLKRANDAMKNVPIEEYVIDYETNKKVRNTITANAYSYCEAERIGKGALDKKVEMGKFQKYWIRSIRSLREINDTL